MFQSHQSCSSCKPTHFPHLQQIEVENPVPFQGFNFLLWEIYVEYKTHSLTLESTDKWLKKGGILQAGTFPPSTKPHSVIRGVDYVLHYCETLQGT